MSEEAFETVGGVPVPNDRETELWNEMRAQRKEMFRLCVGMDIDGSGPEHWQEFRQTTKEICRLAREMDGASSALEEEQARVSEAYKAWVHEIWAGLR